MPKKQKSTNFAISNNKTQKTNKELNMQTNLDSKLEKNPSLNNQILEDFEEETTSTTSTNNLKTIIFIISALIVIVEISLNYLLNIQFEVKIIVEVASIIISALVFLKVIKTNNKKDIIEVNKEIKSSINESIKELKKDEE